MGNQELDNEVLNAELRNLQNQEVQLIQRMMMNKLNLYHFLMLGDCWQCFYEHRLRDVWGESKNK